LLGILYHVFLANLSLFIEFGLSKNFVTLKHLQIVTLSILPEASASMLHWWITHKVLCLLFLRAGNLNVNLIFNFIARDGCASLTSRNYCILLGATQFERRALPYFWHGSLFVRRYRLCNFLHHLCPLGERCGNLL